MVRPPLLSQEGNTPTFDIGFFMIVMTTDLSGLKLHGRGKVRDIYDLGDHFLIVATDRLSAFDVVLPSPISDKGKVLTQMSSFWFNHFREFVPSHVVATNVAD